MDCYNLIIADPPFSFSDKLTMNPDIKRGAEANYPTMTNEDIINLDIKKIAAEDSLLALWVPSSLLELGVEIVNSWGFKLKQTFIWVKTKKNAEKINELSFGMGRLMRQCHELVLIGTRGKIYQHLKNRSQRSVVMAPNLKHSQKPNDLHERLDLMFPDKELKRVELFARREYPGWLCLGNEINGEDIRESLEKLINGR